MRYFPHTPEIKEKMLNFLNIKDIEELFSIIPDSLKIKNLPFEAMDEIELTKWFSNLIENNISCSNYICFMGAGAYDHFIPACINHIISRSEFYTAYTPYQAEVSQGTLQSIYEYQSMISNLTGMDIANASMYDGATALAEAALMILRTTKKKKVLIANSIHPWYIEVVKTYLEATSYEYEFVNINPEQGIISEEHLKELVEKYKHEIGCFLLMSPNFYGLIEPGPEISDLLKKFNINFVVCTDLLSLAIFEAPGNYGADVVVGEAQPFGMALNFGGPFLGFFSAKKEWLKKLPGRISGKTKDRHGKPAYVLTLQTREQHIRREKATSNICTNNALCALIATIFMSLCGTIGLEKIAIQCVVKTSYLYENLVKLEKVKKVFKNKLIFKEFLIEFDNINAEHIYEKMLGRKFLCGVPLTRLIPDANKNQMLIAVTEKRSKEELDSYIKNLKEILMEY